MDWIMQPLSGFASLDDPNLAEDNYCENGGVLTATCTCTGGLKIKS